MSVQTSIALITLSYDHLKFAGFLNWVLSNVMRDRVFSMLDLLPLAHYMMHSRCLPAVASAVSNSVTL